MYIWTKGTQKFVIFFVQNEDNVSERESKSKFFMKHVLIIIIIWLCY